MSRVDIQPELVVAAAKILHKRVSGADHSDRAEPFQPTHRSQPGLEPTMIGFDEVVRILLHNVTRGRRQLIEYPRVGRRPISAHLGWAWAVFESTGEEPASGRQIPLLGHQDINDLAILVDRPVQIDPTPSDLDIVSSTNHRSPGACRQGRAASTSSGVNRCTHRYTVTWSTSMPRSASNSSTSLYDRP
jgi:hypothetical protein